MTQDISKYNVIEGIYGEGLIGHRDDLIKLFKAHLKEDFNMFSVDGILEVANLLKELDMYSGNYLIYVNSLNTPQSYYEVKIISKGV